MARVKVMQKCFTSWWVAGLKVKCPQKEFSVQGALVNPNIEFPMNDF